MSTRPNRAPNPPRDMSNAQADELVDSDFLAPYHFNEQPAVVQIRSVFQEEVWNRNAGRYDLVAIFYFNGYEKGLKVPPTHVIRAINMFGSDISRWIGKNIGLIHEKEEVFGEVYYLTRLDPNPVSQPQAAPPPQSPPLITGEQMEALNGYGMQAYGDNWGTQQSRLIQSVSQNTKSQINELSSIEAQQLIDGIVNKINQQPAAAPPMSDNGQESQPPPQQQETKGYTREDYQQQEQPPPEQPPQGQRVEF